MAIALKRLSPQQVDAAFKAVASEQRRQILRMLAACASESGASCGTTDEVCACKISERLRLAPSTVSHHMATLRRAGLVSARKDGTWVHYTLRREAVREIVAELLDL